MSRALKFVALFATALAVAIVAGCGGGGGSAAPSIASDEFLGVEAVGTLSATRAGLFRAPAVRAGNTTDLNSAYPNCYIAPEQYSVALTKFELMKSADDSDPYVVFDTGDLTNPKTVNLTDGQSASFGENAELPPAGTYTHVRMTVVYFQMTIPVDSGHGIATETFRAYASSVGNIKHGDIVEVSNGNCYWMSSPQYSSLPNFDDDLFTVTTDDGPRPDDNCGYDYGENSEAVARSMVVQEFYFSRDNSESPDPFVAVLQLAEPVVIPENPTGKYQIMTAFDVTSSDQDDNATGAFVFDDVDNDGVFEPGSGFDDTNGVGRDYNDGTHGEPMFSILPPIIHMSCARTDG